MSTAVAAMPGCVDRKAALAFRADHYHRDLMRARLGGRLNRQLDNPGFGLACRSAAGRGSVQFGRLCFTLPARRSALGWLRQAGVSFLIAFIICTVTLRMNQVIPSYSIDIASGIIEQWVSNWHNYKAKTSNMLWRIWENVPISRPTPQIYDFLSLLRIQNIL